MEIMQSADPTGENASGWVGVGWTRRLDPTRALSVGTNVPVVFSGTRQKASTLADSTTPGDQMACGRRPEFSQGLRRVAIMFTPTSPPLRPTSPRRAATCSPSAQKRLRRSSRKSPPPRHQSHPGDIGTQLDVVAELIKAGLPTKAYGVMSSSFTRVPQSIEKNQSISFKFL